jgi:hypothetical protein
MKEATSTSTSIFAFAICQGPPKKPPKKNTDQKTNLPNKQPTDFPLFFFLGAPCATPCVGCGFVTSTTTAAVQIKSNSHVTVYYQPVEFTSCVFAVLFLIFEEEEMLP